MTIIAEFIRVNLTRRIKFDLSCYSSYISITMISYKHLQIIWTMQFNSSGLLDWLQSIWLIGTNLVCLHFISFSSNHHHYFSCLVGWWTLGFNVIFHGTQHWIKQDQCKLVCVPTWSGSSDNVKGEQESGVWWSWYLCLSTTDHTQPSSSVSILHSTS